MVTPVRRRALVTASAAIAGAWGRARAAEPAETPPPFYSHGGQYTTLRPLRTAPSRPTATAGGSVIDFAKLHGQIVVLNFWATWCIPCIYEMPSLDRLQTLRGNQGVTVLPVAMDHDGKPAIEAFYRQHNLSHLGVYADPQQQVGYFETANPGGGVFALYALPITYLIDPRGVIRGYVPGAAEWASSQAGRLFDYLASQ